MARPSLSASRPSAGIFVNGKRLRTRCDRQHQRQRRPTFNGTDASVRIGRSGREPQSHLRFCQNTSAAGGSTNFYITGGGAKFQLGSEVDSRGRCRSACTAVGTGDLGNTMDGYLSNHRQRRHQLVWNHGNTITGSQKIINDAISQVATLRGRLGAFQTDVLDTNTNSLQVALENVTVSESDIEDANFAAGNRQPHAGANPRAGHHFGARPGQLGAGGDSQTPQLTPDPRDRRITP